jgi:similar to stage IV sporulation protein
MLAAVFLALRASSLFVWEIDVYGNEGTPARAILGALRELGFGYGTFVPSVVSEELSDKIILELPQLQWFAVNIRGSHADVLVRERVDRPELTDARAAEAVCASKGGLIVKMSVLAGEPARSVGDTVTAGDVLVSGATRGGTTSASAEVWARTWYELTARLPDMYVKRYTGNVKYRRYAVFGGGKIKLSVNSGISWANYDKIITERKLRLPLGGVLPITVVTERYEEYTLPRAADMAADAEETLRRALMSRLDGLVGDGEIRAAVFETSEADGVSVMTLRAECVEQIAVRRPMAAPERADMPGQS